MKLRICVLALVGLMSPIVQAFGHHSFAAEYDEKKVQTITGVVTRFEWTNPHVRFYVDVKDDKGAVTQWAFEGYPPNMLVRQGWRKDVSLKPGMTVTVQGWRARVEPNLVAAREVSFADGFKLTSGPPAGTGGQ